MSACEVNEPESTCAGRMNGVVGGSGITGSLGRRLSTSRIASWLGRSGRRSRVCRSGCRCRKSSRLMSSWNESQLSVVGALSSRPFELALALLLGIPVLDLTA